MIRQRAVTVVVLQSGDRRTTRTFLGELAKCTGANDNVLLASPPRAARGCESDPRTAAREAVFDETVWRTKGRDGTFRRHDRAKGQDRPVLNQFIVFVDDRVTTSGAWIDRLVRVLEGHPKAVVAPRSNQSCGEDLYVGIPFRPYEPGARSAFLARSAKIREDLSSKVTLLGGPCIAMSLETFGGRERLYAEIEALDLGATTARVTATGADLFVIDTVFLFHPGGAPITRDRRPPDGRLISACLIVKNEEHNLARCLDSIAGVVDEIIVYDTGSTDSTVEIARRYSDSVVSGHWDDNFARARNDALAHCRGEWILWLDADEALMCNDPEALRHRLRSASSDAEGLIVLIDNLRGTEASTPLTHPACRLFRRAVGHWQGALHEQITAREGNPVMSIIEAPMLEDLVRIRHWGYLQSAMVEKTKGERNLRTAFGDLAGSDELDIAERVLSLGRSHQLAGKSESGIELCRLAVDLATYPPTRRMALRGVIEGLTARERFDEALSYIEPLRRAGAAPLADYLEGLALLGAGRPGEALRSLEAIAPGLDIDGFEYSALFTAGARATALSRLDRPREAAEVLLGSLAAQGGIDAHLGLLLESMDAAGLDPGLAYDAIGEERILAFVPQLMQILPETADRCCEAWTMRAPASKAILAVASQIATRLDVRRQEVWSERLRSVGLHSACPLIGTARLIERPHADRLASATRAVVRFDDPRGRLLQRALKLGPTKVAPGLGSGRQVPRSGRSILVIDHEVASTRALASSAVLRAMGHDVTLIHPLPVTETFAMMNPLEVGVHGWPERRGARWEAACLSLIAQVYAARPIDCVVLMPSTEPLRDSIAAMLPVTEVHTEIDRWLPVTAFDLYGVAATAPLNERLGIAIAGNLRDAPDEEIDRFRTLLAPLLIANLGNEPMVLIGDDPDGVLRAALPLGVSIGAVADPIPWIQTARVLLVVTERGLDQWQSLGALCNTPSFGIPSEDAYLEPLARAIFGLVTNDAIWTAQAPCARIAPGEIARERVGLDGVDIDRVPPNASSEGGRARPNVIDSPREVRLIGDLYSHASLARVNRELAFRLNGIPDFDLAVEDRTNWAHGSDTGARVDAQNLHPATPGAGAAIEIRHTWPPDFSAAAGRVAMILPWEFGSYPAEWVGPIRDIVDEVWVPSNWVREGAIASGVDAARVFVVPNGVDTNVYRPPGDSRLLSTTRRTRFLFVGGLIERKGADVLLEVYLSNFTADDDVCLVVKPFGSGSVYETGAIESTLRRASGSRGPEIEIIDEDLDEAAMAALYRSCTALVHPYRGEGFGLPIAEAMACGLPVIVTDGGAARDFCDTSTGWLVESTQTPVSAATFTASMGGSWWLEPSRSSLATAMRAVIDDPEDARRRGRNGARRIAEQFTWDHAAAKAHARILALLSSSDRHENDHGPSPRNQDDLPPARRAGSRSPREHAIASREPRATIVVSVGPDCKDTRALKWARREVANDPSVDLVVADDLAPFLRTKPTLLTGDRIRVLRNWPTLGSARSIQGATALATGDVVVLVSADVGVNAGAIAALLAPFSSDPSVGVVLPAMRRAPGSPVVAPPLIALRKSTITSIGGHRALALASGDGSGGRVPLLAAETMLEVARANWRTVEIALEIQSADGLVDSWPEAPAARQGERPTWLPVPLPDRPRPGLNVVGLLEASCGIGDAGRRYVEAAEVTGIDLSTFSFHLHGSPEQPYQHRGERRFDHDVNLFVMNADIYVSFLAHASQAVVRDRHNILLPFWELEELTPAFDVFRIVDEVWAASTFLERTFRAHTDRPVTAMPLPVRRRVGSPRRSRHDLSLPEGFVFLTTFDFASLAMRKNSAGVISAFCRAFVPGEGPVLVLKTLNSHRDPNGVRQLRQLAGRRRDIVMLDGYLDDETVSEMLGSADCYVSLHRSEGFGLTLAEAMAWATPVIATAYSGNLDFMSAENSYLVPFDWSSVPYTLSGTYPVGARWAEPRIADAAAAMRAVFDDPIGAKRRGARGQHDIRHSHSPERVAAIISDRLATIDATRLRPVGEPEPDLALSKSVPR